MSSPLSQIQWSEPIKVVVTPLDGAVRAINVGVMRLYRNLVDERIRLYDLFWNNPNDSCDPSSMATRFGTGLQAMFADDAEAVALIAKIAANNGITPPAAAVAGLPDGWTVSFNPDGSGTVTKTGT